MCRVARSIASALARHRLHSHPPTRAPLFASRISPSPPCPTLPVAMPGGDGAHRDKRRRSGSKAASSDVAPVEDGFTDILAGAGLRLQASGPDTLGAPTRAHTHPPAKGTFTVSTPLPHTYAHPSQLLPVARILCGEWQFYQRSFSPHTMYCAPLCSAAMGCPPPR